MRRYSTRAPEYKWRAEHVHDRSSLRCQLVSTSSLCLINMTSIVSIVQISIVFYGFKDELLIFLYSVGALLKVFIFYGVWYLNPGGLSLWLTFKYVVNLLPGWIRVHCNYLLTSVFWTTLESFSLAACMALIMPVTSCKCLLLFIFHSRQCSICSSELMFACVPPDVNALTNFSPGQERLCTFSRMFV